MKSISCIIPVFNLDSGENFKRLSKLLESLSLASKELIPKYYEVILIIDDPTYNKTNEILSLLSEVGLRGCSRVFLNSQNMGQSYSRNRGCHEASNEFLHFIDQDDFINDLFYTSLIHDPNQDFFIAKPKFYLEKIKKEVQATTFITRLIYRNAKKIGQLWPLLFSNIVYSPGQIIIRKSKFMDAGEFPLLKNRGSDDYGLFYNLVQYSSAKVFFMNEAVFYYRIHGNQNSKTLNMDKSISEFFQNLRITNFKQNLIRNMKLNNFYRPFSKLAYIFFFKRV